MPSLFERWADLWQRVRAQGDAEAPFSHLQALYAEPHRAYHTFHHIEALFREFESVRGLATDPESIELAIWYHDAHYDTKAKDNEERSAELFRETAKRAGIRPALVELVDGLILATKHSAQPEDWDQRLFCDIDLSILGQPRETFDEYERQIRKEYEWVPQNAYIAGRGAILQSFLDRPSIFALQPFIDQYEVAARENLGWSIAGLGLKFLG